MKTNLHLTRIGPMLCCLLLLVSCKGSVTPSGQMVLVEQVLSGQTIEVVGQASRLSLSASDRTADPRRVRLIGIEAPDLRQQPWGIEARQQLAELLGNGPVLLELDVEKRDQYQRQLGYIWATDSLLNEEMVKRGYALAKPRSPNTKYDERLANAQARARILGLGIWNPTEPMGITPTEFRRASWDR